VQFFDDDNGTVSESGGVAADFAISARASAGLEIASRDLSMPFNNQGVIEFEERKQQSKRAYAYWLPSERIALSLEARDQDFERGLTFTSMDLREVPLTFRYFAPSGFWLGTSATYVSQEGLFTGPGGAADVPGSDSFVVVDAVLAYRLPRRLGTISVHATNLLDEEFQFQEIDLNVPPRYIPDTQVFLRFSATF
jgi:hypothetical protein